MNHKRIVHVVVVLSLFQERVEQFAAITGTDEALAQFFLQDRNWDIEVKSFRMRS